MSKLNHLVLFASLLVVGSVAALPSNTPEADGGAPESLIQSPRGGGGESSLQLGISELYADIFVRRPLFAAGIHWPVEVRPLATLDGPAVLAAHAAIQHVLARFPKEYAGSCTYSAKALEVVVGEQGGLYFVRINQRPERCGRFAAGVSLTPDWFELYAVSSDGKVLARYPYQP
ncbi:hypothetical protein [Archangium violaceum]|uniref:hypothetical protein n=1 Tax=Archangium violaceum TaxID=83451 RepID=UPI0036DEA6E9